MDTQGRIYSHLKGTHGPDGKLAYGPEDLECIEGSFTELTAPVQPGADSLVAERMGLLLGKIQSGKTKSFIGLIGVAFDNGFDVAVVLTKNSGTLAAQTTKRLASTFQHFAGHVFAHDIMMLGRRGIPAYVASQKLILVVKKQHTNVKKAIDLLTAEASLFKDKRMLIIDDEADTASVSYVGKQEQLDLAKVAKLLNTLRNQAHNSYFLQVTATPYSLLMQNEGGAIEGRAGLRSLRPKFVKLVPVHPKYIGSDHYFEESKDRSHPASRLYSQVTQDELELMKEEPHRRGFKVETDCLTSPKVAGLREAVTRFIVGGCLRRLQQVSQGRNSTNFALLIHTHAPKASHAWQDRLVLQMVNDLVRTESEGSFDRISGLFEEAYDNLADSVRLAGFALPGKELVLESVRTALREQWVNVLCVNSDEEVDQHLDPLTGELSLLTPLTIFVGGQYLDRGVTLTGLIGFYYGRSPKSFQQDTVLQHCRHFGFRSPEDMSVTRFYTSCQIYAALQRMHRTDVLLRTRIQQGRFLDGIRILEKMARDGIKLCSPAKIKASRVNCVDSSSRILPQGFNTRSTSDLRSINAAIERILSKAGVGRGPGRDQGVLDLADAHEIIRLTGDSIGSFTSGYEESWDVKEVQGLLQTLADDDSEGRDRGKVGVLVRWDRDRPWEEIPTDTPDNPRVDTDIARRNAARYPVLLLLHQKGKGLGGGRDWHGGPFFWPVLFPPAGDRAYMYAMAARRRR